MASFDLMVQFLRTFLLGSHLNDEIFAICAEIFHMNKIHLNVNSASDLRLNKLVDQYRHGFVNEKMCEMIGVCESSWTRFSKNITTRFSS